MTREVALSRGMVALVDDADYELVASFGSWYADKSRATYYARRNYWTSDHQCKSMRMHTVITGWEMVDHVNGNGLDNRRVNLRSATFVQNAQNRRIRSDSVSGFKGVRRRAGRGRFHASIYVSGRVISLGGHPTAEDAARAYDIAALHHFGPFARLNFPMQQETA